MSNLSDSSDSLYIRSHELGNLIWFVIHPIRYFSLWFIFYKSRTNQTNITNIQINISLIRTNWTNIYSYICNICDIWPHELDKSDKLNCPICDSPNLYFMEIRFVRFAWFALPDLLWFAWFARQAFPIRPSLISTGLQWGVVWPNINYKVRWSDVKQRIKTKYFDVCNYIKSKIQDWGELKLLQFICTKYVE